jgi:hypothetical protein
VSLYIFVHERLNVLPFDPVIRIVARLAALDYGARGVTGRVSEKEEQGEPGKISSTSSVDSSRRIGGSQSSGPSAGDDSWDSGRRRGRGGRARYGGRVGTGGRRANTTDTIVIASTDDILGNSIGAARALDIDDPASQVTQPERSSASQANSTDLERPLSGWDPTPSRRPDTQATNATAGPSAAASARAPSLPQFATDFGIAGLQGGGPTAEDMLVSWLASPEIYPTWTLPDTVARFAMLASLQQSMSATRMAERTTDSIISKVRLTCQPFYTRLWFRPTFCIDRANPDRGRRCVRRGST